MTTWLDDRADDLSWQLARAFLFRLAPERAHELTLSVLDLPGAGAAAGLMGCRHIADPVHLMGLRFSNRVGLAAGLDKNGRHVDGLANLGFGFIEVGTVTPRAQPGNDKPRLFRLTEHEALINRFGFNNDGIDSFIAHVRRARYRGVLGLNIGRNATTPNEQAIDDYLTCLGRCHPHASYIAVNVSSPNTRNLRDLQQSQALSTMLGALAAENKRLKASTGRHVPLLLKIAPDLDDGGIDAIAEQLVVHHIDGVIATNTTVARDYVAASPHAREGGGLSGRPLAGRATAVVARLRRVLPSRFPIIGVGGIIDVDQVRAKLDAGADLVQLYTGLIYRGPRFVQACAATARAWGTARSAN